VTSTDDTVHPAADVDVDADDQRSARTRRRPAGSRGRLVGWLALVVVLVGALGYGVTDDGGPRSAGDRARNLAESIACPQCDGQSVADSDSDAANGIRTLIDERIAAGASDAEIRDELAAAYGERVLLTPGRSGVSSLVWTLPVVALVAAVAGLAFAFRRWRGGGAARASDADRAVVEAARARTGGGGAGDGAP
jgi:cytochrome c-type biogenesis protein CcmH